MVYLIDDDMSIRRAYEFFLGSAGMDFISFGSAEEFLDEAKPVFNDLIILDLCMPGMSGCDLLKKLYQDNSSIPVIVVSAFDDQHNREICRKYGVREFLRKPVDGEALIDLIKYNIQL
jgi:FixJ family two-component response regulator